MNGNTVSREKLLKILESVRLAPTSMGLQPFRILAVEDPKIRQDIFEQGCSQPQVLECSHLLIFAGWNSVTEEKVDNYMETIAETRQIEVDLLDGFKKSILKFIGSQSPPKIREWSARQVYLALGTAIDAAALSHVDATPMEGFDSAAIDRYFDLDASDLHTVVLLALGYRDRQKDEFVDAPKVRRHFDELFEII